MERKLLATAICAALAFATTTTSARAQQASPPQEVDEAEQTAPPEDDATDLDRIVVTGSRIPRAQVETATPVTTITSEEIQRQGYRNVSDVLRALPLATGSVQDNQFAGFTAAATTISLLGLSPSFTLTLLDGRPLADYPLLYNGQSNFTDLTSIPVGMVERIDIVPGNQSSIYGSAAIAGVVNIVLKKKIEGVQLGVRVGGYSDGGGDNARVQLIGGLNRDPLNLVWGLQYGQQDPIYLTDRKYTDRTDDNPNPDLRYASRTHIILNANGLYDDPGTLCDNVSSLFGGTTQVDLRPGRGNFCGSRAQPGFVSLLNEERNMSGYFNARYAINDNAEAYATVLLGKNRARNDSGSRFWVPDYNGDTQNYVWNSAEQTLETYQRIFGPEEMPDDARFATTDARSYSVALGVQGRVGAGNWDYDAYFSRSGYRVESDQLWPLVDPMEDFFREQFMGPQLGTYYGYPVYEPNKPGLYQVVTRDQFRSFSDNIHNVSRTWTQNLNLQLTNAELFSLPAGPVGFATVLQAGEQYWDNPVDARVAGGAFFGINGTSGQGKRRNQALGVEFSVPLLSSLTANLSARYDAYQNVDAGSDAAPTWKVGLEFRPVDGLLLRGNVGTAFRAPDMGYIFTGGNGFFSSETDFYKCEIDPANCATSYTGLSVEANQLGNPDLESITADSYGFGFVWSPSADFDLRADYYNVSIDDEVLPQSTTQTLTDENDCRQGRQDINSAFCQEVLARVIRTAPNPGNPRLSENLDLIIVRGVNIAKEEVSGITAGTNWRFDAGRVGRFNFGLEYNFTIDHTTQASPDAEVYDTFSSGQLLSAEFKSIASGDIGWELGRWSANLHGVRYGSTPNYAKQFSTDPDNPYVTSNGIGPGKVSPWILYNVSVDYDVTDNSTLSLIVNNVRNSRPPKDPSYDGLQGFAPPYYNIFAYNGYGRSWWIEYKINFGAGG